MQDSAQKLHQKPQRELAAKVRCLDKFFAECLNGKQPHAVRDWDLKFIISMKDWFDRDNKQATEKQASKIEQIYNIYESMDEQNVESEFVFEWEEYVR